MPEDLAMNQLLFIFNPTSGTGQVKGALASVLDVFTKAGWITTSYPTQCKGDGARAAREPALTGWCAPVGTGLSARWPPD